jgi:hypothetical protein
MSVNLRRAGVIGATTLGLLFAAAVLAPPRPDARSVRGTTRTSVNRNVNVHRSVGVHRDVDVDAVVGGVVRALPPSCRSVVIGNAAYEQCERAWYRPQYSGSQITYVVVDPPR